jgi:hypothetical protein
MIALVFYGEKADNQRVVIKLKRRGIATRLTNDCESLCALYGFASWIAPRNIFIRLLKPFIQNLGDIVAQCDFHREIANLRQAREDFAPLDFIQIPEVYNTSGITDYIVMEYIAGTHVLPTDTMMDIRLDYMEKFTTFMAYSYLFNAIQNTDLHAGNIIFTPAGFGIIDYGMAIQLSDEMHDVVLSIAGTIKGDTPLHEIDFIDTFKHIFSPPLDPDEITDRAAVENLCIAISQPLLDAVDLDELNIMDNLDKLAVHLRRPIALHADCYKTILSISMMGQKIAILGPDYNNAAELRAIEIRALKRAFALIM